jgi:hypothetical protein
VALAGLADLPATVHVIGAVVGKLYAAADIGPADLDRAADRFTVFDDIGIRIR